MHRRLLTAALLPAFATLLGSLAPVSLAAPGLLAFSAAPSAALPTALPTTRAAQVDPLEVLVERELARAAERGSATAPLWARALGLRDAADALAASGREGPRLDSLLDKRLSAGLAPEALLLVVATRLTGTDVDPKPLIESLLPLARGADESVAAEAADLLSKPALRRIDRDDRSKFATQLLDVARDGSRAPNLRIHAARGAFALGGGAEKRAARGEMLAFLRSSDAELRSRAALALAESGDEIVGDLEREMERIAALPGPQGELADAYLKAERGKRLRDAKLEDLKASYDNQTLPDELRRVTAVLDLVEAMHIDGAIATREELVDAGLGGILRYLDDHSAYFSPEAYANFIQDLEAEYGGIGAFVGEDREDGLFTITRPIYSGPAYRAGLQSDDKIVRVDEWPTVGQPTEDVIKRLKGQPGTTVRLYIWRRGMAPELIERPTPDMRVEVTRAQIEIPAVHTQMLPGGVGLVELSQFSRVASSEFEAALEQLKAQGMRAFVLDLRSNSGGLLDEAVNVADLFLGPKELVVTTEFREQPAQTHYTRRPPVLNKDIPMAVLISRFSASASEIVAGALQDHGRAVLVGDRSFGKGSVQNLIPLRGYADDRFVDENRNGRYDPWEALSIDHNKNGAFDFAPRVKLTIARYLLPSGRSIHREFDRDRNVLSEGGVEPDVRVELPRLDSWELTERRRVLGTNAVRHYVDTWFADDPARARALAETDGKETGRYPGFDAFFAGLGTTLDMDDVRTLVRAEVRRRVQDLRGGEFPIGDFQEDPQMQAAIRAVLAPLGVEPGSVAEFGPIFGAVVMDDSAPKLDAQLAHLDPIQREALAGALDSLRAARAADGRLTPEELQRVLELLGRLDR